MVTYLILCTFTEMHYALYYNGMVYLVNNELLLFPTDSSFLITRFKKLQPLYVPQINGVDFVY